MKNNTRTNSLIKFYLVIGDFIMLNVLLALAVYSPYCIVRGSDVEKRVFMLICNAAMLISEYWFSTIIHERLVGIDSILKRISMLVIIQVLTSFILLRAMQFDSRVGIPLLIIGTVMMIVFIPVRCIERLLLKRMRQKGFNTRTVTLVGSHEELRKLHDKLNQDPTLGYKVVGYYGSMDYQPKKGGLDDFVRLLDTPDQLVLGDELYMCVPRTESSLIEHTESLCDRKMVKFYYVPLLEEAINLQPVMLDDLELFTTYTSPLEDPMNRVIKRFFDILVSFLCLILTALLFPFIAMIIKIQSPGPIFFRQRRTGLDGHEFWMYKFRSMHVNADADRLQATEDDPRKYPFGNFMRKTNIDELPQFWNVFRGDMSIVGPRPHMLAHTEQYSHLIEKYMIRHFVKPGVTGWAQVTGFRGETKELWQMEGRVERDIWYIQHWSFWLDIRIIWKTFATFFVHDKNAY
jgi:putative colanic acid biosynthesis UDP-glucose lipid carrier transferase